jgi:hypothetical protein
VRFHGERSEGFRALAAALQVGLKVSALRRVWPILDGEPTGPWWELTFVLPGPTTGAAPAAPGPGKAIPRPPCREPARGHPPAQG